jgi:PAS domain S-box-containing protein
MTGTLIRVLHVDDDLEFVDLTSTFLEQNDDQLTVETATSGSDALDRLLVAGEPLDCIVSDYDMPRMNGLEFLEAVREQKPNLPFILYTGKGSEEIASEAISRGVTEYMQKETGTNQYSVLANRIFNAVDRYRAEQRVDEERTRFQAVFEQASDAMLIANDNGTLVNVNSAACCLFGRSEDELLGRTAEEFIVEDFDFETAWDSFQQINDLRGLFPVKRPDGTMRVAEYAASTNIMPGKHLSVLRDITEQRKSEHELYLEKERLSEFAGVLSHDLQNPVQVATGRLELLANGVAPEARDEHLTAARNAVARIEHVIDDVLAISKTNEEKREISEVAFSEVAEQVWHRVGSENSQVDIEPGIVVSADEGRLERLLTNLIRNAIEHSGETVHITIGRLDDDDGFFIEDDGPGIPEDDRDTVFDWQHSTKAGGTGIGLKSVKQIVNSEGWLISITDGEADGARFEITGITVEE